MDLVQVGSIHPQVPEHEIVSSPKDRSGRSRWDAALHVQEDTRPPQLPERDGRPSPWKKGLYGLGHRWPPRQDPGHVQFSGSKPWKPRQVMYSKWEYISGVPKEAELQNILFLQLPESHECPLPLGATVA